MSLDPLKILVVGDAILDRYLIGRWAKPNPEAPDGMVFAVERTEDRLGGAAAVAMIARHLPCQAEPHVTLICGLGTFHGSSIKELAFKAGVEVVDSPLCGDNALKIRLRDLDTGRVHRDRIDRDPAPGQGLTEWRASLLGAYAVTKGGWGAVLVADYGKGGVTAPLIDVLSQLPRSVPVIVDPARARPWSDYPEWWVVKANWVEWDNGRLDDGRRNYIVTHGPQPIQARIDGRAYSVTPPTIDHVVDVTGAGDSVLAALGVAIAQGKGWQEALEYAAAAGARQCQQVGVGTV